MFQTKALGKWSVKAAMLSGVTSCKQIRAHIGFVTLKVMFNSSSISSFTHGFLWLLTASHNQFLFACLRIVFSINVKSQWCLRQCNIFLWTICILMDFPKHFFTISMGLPIVYFKGSQLWRFSVSEGCSKLSKQCRSRLDYAAFHFGLHCLPRYRFRSFKYTNG